MKDNISFFKELDATVLHSLCEKDSGCYYDSLLDRLDSMKKPDEYAGAPEILGLVYGTYCPIYIYSKVSEKYVCGMKYGDETFPNVEPIRLLYTPDATNSPGHYNLLVDQNTISTSHTVIDIQKNSDDIFETLRSLCKASCISGTDPSIDTVFNDRNEPFSAFSSNEDGYPKDSLPHKTLSHHRTLSEANIDLSLLESSLSIESAHTTCTSINPFGHLTLDDSEIVSEEQSIKKLQTFCEKHDMQAVLLGKGDNTNKSGKGEKISKFVLPSLKRSLTMQDATTETEKSNIVYLRVFKDPADNADTFRKVLDFFVRIVSYWKIIKISSRCRGW